MKHMKPAGTTQHYQMPSIWRLLIGFMTSLSIESWQISMLFYASYLSESTMETSHETSMVHLASLTVLSPYYVGGLQISL